MSSKKSKTSDPHTLLLNRTDEIERINILLYQIVACTIHGKI